MKNENRRRTYDFVSRDDDACPPTVYEVLVDGWTAYYRWLDDLRKALTPRIDPDR